MREAEIENIGTKPNIKYTKKTAQEDEELGKLYVESGMSIAALARVYGVTRQAMLSRLKQIKVWNKTKIPVNKKAIVAQCLKGETLTEIVEVTGHSKVSIHRVLQDAGLKCKRSRPKK